MNLEWNPPNISDRAAHLISGAEHSSSVVFGFERKDGSIAPARDFFSAAVNETDLQGIFAGEFNRSGSTDQAFEEATRSLHEAIKDAIKSDRWQWNKTTKRKNGETVSSPRDAVDTRELLNSQSIDWVE